MWIILFHFFDFMWTYCSQRKGYDLWTWFMNQVVTHKLWWIGDCKIVLQEVITFLKDCIMLKLFLCKLFAFVLNSLSWYACLCFHMLYWDGSSLFVPLPVSWHLVLIYSVGSRFVFAGEMNCVTWYKLSVCNAKTLSLGCEFIFPPHLKSGCKLFL